MGSRESGEPADRRTPRVLQTGTYNSLNKGDAAMEIAMREQLRATGVDVVVSCPFPDLDQPVYGDAIVRSRRRNLPLSALLVVLGGLWRLTGRRFPILLVDDEGRAMADADLIVDLSGDMLTDEHGPHVAISHYFPMLRARALGRRYAVVAQSIGPFRTTTPLAHRVLRSASLVTARETTTERDVTARFPDVDVVRTADMAFLLEPRPIAIELPPGPRVVVSVSSLVGTMLERSSDLDLVEQMAAALDALSTDEATTTVIVSHVTGPKASQDDRVLARELADRMSTPVVVVDDDLDPREIKAVIGTADLMVGSRMHANIAALSQCVPTVALAYSHKSVGIMTDLGLGANVVDCRQPVADGTVTKVVARAWADRDTTRNGLEPAVEVMKRDARRNVELVLGLLDDGPDPQTG